MAYGVAAGLIGQAAQRSAKPPVEQLKTAGGSIAKVPVRVGNEIVHVSAESDLGREELEYQKAIERQRKEQAARPVYSNTLADRARVGLSAAAEATRDTAGDVAGGVKRSGETIVDILQTVETWHIAIGGLVLYWLVISRS